MWKSIVAVATLLSLSCADARPRGATPQAQIFYNIVSDGGAACNGDVVTVTRTTSITSGTKNLSVTANTFSSGDVGKAIGVPGAGSGGGTLLTTIQTFTDAQNVVLAANAGATLSSVSTAITYGTDDAPKFAAFNTWARVNQGPSNQIILTIPNGASCWFGTAQLISGTTLLSAWAAGINNLIVEGTGATLNSVGGFGFQLAGQGIIQIGLTSANGQSARIQTANAGASTITLTSASFSAGYISRFPVGKWIMLAGLDIQGIWQTPYGFPPNANYFEWRKITAVDSGTGVITLDRPLSNTYLSTWPEYNNGNAFEVDNGGPATIYALSDTWNTTVEYRGLTIKQDGQTYAQGRNVTYRNVTFPTGGSGIPTQNETFSAINTSYAGLTMEVDKLIGTLTLDNININIIDFQSSSTNLLVLKNSTIAVSLTGTPKRAEITDTTMATFKPGAFAYGASTGAVICTRCNVTTFDGNGGIFQNSPSDYTLSGSTISFANTSVTGAGPPNRIFIPGGNIYFDLPSRFTSGLFTVQTITQDATNVTVQTSGGFPTGSALTYRTHPAPQFTCDACTGDATLVAMNVQNGATPLAPLGTYSKRTYTPTSAQGDLGALKSKGKIVSLTVDVTQAYTGSGSATLNVTGQFHLFTIKQSDWSEYDWLPTINLKQTGTRVITPSGTTCNGSAGACAGDGCIQPASGCFSLPEAVWIQDGIAPRMDSTFSGGTAPTFTITLQTDQGVVP